MHISTEHRHDSAAPHLAALDGVRGLAALYVVLHHVWLQHRDLGPFGAFQFGRPAVIVFVVISGFCLTLSALRSGSETFDYERYARKCMRHLLPQYYAGIGFTLLMIAVFVGANRGTHWAISLPASKESIVHALLLIQNFTGDVSKVNHAYWFMPLVWQLHIAFPLLYLALRRATLVPFLAIGVLLGAATFSLAQGTTMEGGQFHMVGAFCFGMAAAMAASKDGLRHRLASPLVHLACAAIVASYAAWMLRNPASQNDILASDMLTGTISALFLLVLAGGAGPINRVLGWKPFVLLGAISYALYLTHAPLIEFVDLYVVSALDVERASVPWMNAAIGMPIMLGVAALFHWLFAPSAPKAVTTNDALPPAPAQA